MVNETLETILNHRSIRKFKDEKLSKEQIHTLVQAAQQASTSSNVMAYTIIGISDERLKEELYKISGHSHVKTNGHLFIFCGDLHRINQIASNEEQVRMQESLESTEQFIVATIDASLAAQNLAIAAESIGLGICYIGSLRNNISRVNDLLELPDHVVPFFGIVTGYPNHSPEVKPRLPLEAIYHENTYQSDEQQFKLVEKYDEQLGNYYQSRSSNKKMDTWTDQMIRKYSNPIRMDVTSFVKSKNLNKR